MSEFKFDLVVTRAYVKDGIRYIAGEASNTSIDLYKTVFTEECQRGFVEDIASALESGDPLQLEAEHEGDLAPFFNFGVIIDGYLDNNKTKIVARLDKSNPFSEWYWDVLNSTPEENRALGRPEKLGLSINGYVKESHDEFNGEIGSFITHFDRVKLRRVGVVKNPGNTDCYAEAMKRSVEEIENGAKEKGTEAGSTTNKEAEVGSSEIKEVEKEGEIISEQDTKIITDDSNELRGNVMSVENQEVELRSEDETVVVTTDEVVETSSEEVLEVAETETDDQVEDEVVEEETLEVAETPEEDAVDRSDEAVVEEVEVTRGELKDTLASREMWEDMCELNSTFSDTMWSLAYSHMWGDQNVDETLSRMQGAVSDYGDLCREILAKKESRAMDTSIAAVQTEDIDDEISLKYSLKAKFSAKNGSGKELVRNIDNSKVSELEAKIAELEAALEVEKEAVRSANESLEAIDSEKAEIARKLEEVSNQPVDRALLPDNEVKEVKREIDIALEKKDSTSALKLYLFGK